MVAVRPRAVEEVVEQTADQLERDVLERDRRAVEQLEQPTAVVELDQRAHVGMVEGGVGLVDDVLEHRAVDGPFDEGPHHGGGDLRRRWCVGEPGEVGIAVGDEQPAVAEPGRSSRASAKSSGGASPRVDR